MERLRSRPLRVLVGMALAFWAGSFIPPVFYGAAQMAFGVSIDKAPFAGLSVLSGLLCTFRAADLLTRPSGAQRAWAKGAAGEEKVGRYLEAMSGPSLTAFHDVSLPGFGGNIDHLVVSTRGVFVVETKTLKGRAEVRRGRLRVNGWDRSRMIEQALGQARAVDSLLARLGYPQVRTIPILCFVGTQLPWWSRGRVRGVYLTTYRKMKGILLSQRTGRLEEGVLRAVGDALSTYLVPPEPVVPLDALPVVESCPRCGRRLTMNTRRRDSQPFYGCTGYPRCRFTRPFASDS